MKVMVNAIYSSLMTDEMLFFECITGSGKIFTTTEYTMYIYHKYTYSSLHSQVTLKINKNALTVGEFEEVFNRIHIDVYVLKYTATFLQIKSKAMSHNTSCFTNICHMHGWH